MKFFILKSFFFLLCFGALKTHAQEQEKKSKPFKLKFGYSSNQIFNGRADSLEVPYLTGSFKYLDKSGFYAKTSLSYLTSSYANRIDLIGLGIGYQKIFNDQFLVSASFDKNFYNSNSFSVSSEILGNAGLNFYYLNDYVDLGTSLAANFTTGKSDISISFDASHEFSFGNDNWSIEPTANVNFSTRYYSEIYSNTRKEKTSNSGSQNRGSDIQTIQTIGAGNLSLLNYEFSLPLYYYGNNFGAWVSPAYSIAQNPAVILTTTTSTRTSGGNGQPQTTTTNVYSTEKIKNYFYVEAGVYFKF